MSWTLIYYISEWVVRVLAIPVVLRRRGPAAATSWLLVIFFLPWPGILLYWLIGENRLPRRRIQRHALRAARDRMLARLEALAPHVVHPKLSPEQTTLVNLVERLGDKPILGGNSGEVFIETDQMIDRLIGDIDRANDHVHLLFYIFADDETGYRVMDALGRAVERGVKCRVLADDVGSWYFLKSLGTQMKQRGIELLSMLPVNIFRRKLARIDLRNHRKLAIVDGRIAYTGSQNIVNADYGTKDLVWHDMMVRITGPIVLQLQSIFVEDWCAESQELLDDERYFPHPEVTGDVVVQTLPSGPTFPTDNYQRMVVAAIYAATERVIITSPYLVPDAPFLQAMETAVLRGVRVDVIVPARCDQILVGAAARAYYEAVLEAGIRIHLHGDGLLHAKTMSVDRSVALIGSGNFDIRSFYLNFEINTLAYGERVTTALRTAQENYLSESTELTLEAWRNRKSHLRIFENMCKLLSPLL